MDGIWKPLVVSSFIVKYLEVYTLFLHSAVVYLQWEEFALTMRAQFVPGSRLFFLPQLTSGLSNAGHMTAAPLAPVNTKWGRS